MKKIKAKVAVAMSGGVDSSVAAALLQKQGYEVIGIFMHFWSDPHYANQQTITNKCCSVDAQNDARRVAEQLGIPLYTFNLDADFKKHIVDNFLAQYAQGLTPNPCVTCNQFIKFGLFWQKAQALGAKFIATGHYVQIKNDRKGSHLLSGKDPAKDQSYFLSRIEPTTLPHLLFPIGQYKKTQVRKIAKKLKLPVFGKPDSQEICFVPEKEHYAFLQRQLDLKTGNIVSVDGQILGQHKGLPLYTIGQRKGLELPNGPWYVVDLNFPKNELIISNNAQEPRLFSDIMYVKDMRWLHEVKLPQKLVVRIRSAHKKELAIVSAENQLLKIKFNKKQRAITPGQTAVIYHKNEVLGGGIIIKK